MRSLRYIFVRAMRKLINPPAISQSRLGENAKCDIGSVVSDSTMGRYSYIGEFTHLLSTDVGDFCSISSYCAIGGAAHPADWVSMSPAFNESKGMMKAKLAKHPYNPYTKTSIGNDVWIGAHCLIKAGVTISDGAVIGMGSVVTHDVGPYEIWAGNPAKMIRKRFDDQTIAALMKIKWWDMDEASLKKYAEYMNDPKKFIEVING